MKKKKNRSLIQRLIDNQISKEEFDELLKGMDDIKARDLYEENLKDHFDAIIGEHGNFPRLGEGDKETPAKENKAPQPIDGKNFFKINNNAFKIAATILLVAVSFITFWMVIEQQDINNSLVVQRPIVPSYVEKITPKGTLASFVLNDGSVARLNVDSKIVYPENFSSDSRQVLLEGQAYFDVQHDTQRPFTISCKNLAVEVVGTSFDINAYETESQISITVESGKVKVHNARQDGTPLLLTKNQKLVYDTSTASFSLTEVESSNEMAWRYGILRFNKTPVAEVERILERWYNVDFKILDSAIYHHKITGVHKNESLVSVLKSLNYALDINYTIEDNVVTLKKNK